ncbi:SEL1-like repeat protein [Aurantiacibacter sp. MUD61]|uniref:SEL1-like repeat protein n=1 Tax=Aurantiacibacter sp. MUD61 TaxID=3009083 RepID=UPI0022EFF58B|nr:SEL1-like repeat protein [Aurantiacibacter sp. MUD61]
MTSEHRALTRAGTDHEAISREVNAILSEFPDDRLAELVTEGDRVAAFVLGQAYESGIDRPVNLERALALYTLAAEPVETERTFYQAPVGSEGYGSTVSTPTRVVTLPAALSARDRVAAMLATQHGD